MLFLGNDLPWNSCGARVILAGCSDRGAFFDFRQPHAVRRVVAGPSPASRARVGLDVAVWHAGAGGGNGCLVYSETLIPSSLAALFITLSPFWYSGLEAMIPGGEKLTGAVLGGIVTGFLGVALLIVPDVLEKGMRGAVWQGFLILQFGSFCWCFRLNSAAASRRERPPVRDCGSRNFPRESFSSSRRCSSADREQTGAFQGIGALAYLVKFGSIIGFSSYVYTLAKLPVAMVSLYTYVNPLVAAVLGSLFYREEPFGWLKGRP